MALPLNMPSRPKIFSRDFIVGQIAVVATANVFAQLLATAVSPVIARLYSPTDFGVFSVYTAFVTVVLVFSGLRYEYAISLPKDTGTATRLLMIALSGGLINAGILVILTLLLGRAVGKWTHLPNYHLLWFVPLGLLAGTAYQCLSYWAIRMERFTLISRTTVWQSITKIGIQLSTGALGLGPVGLLLGDSVGRAAGVFQIGRDAYRHSREFFHEATPDNIWQALVRYRQFPLVAAPAALFNVAALQMPQIAFAVLYGAREAGQLGLATRVVGIPIAVLAAAVAQVFLSHASRMAREHPEHLRKFFVTTASGLAVVGIPAAALLWFVAVPLFARVFGSQWRESGVYCAILCAPLAAEFIVSSISQIVYVLEKNAWQLIADISRTSIIAAVFILAHLLNWGPGFTLRVHASAMVLAYVCTFAMYGIAVYRFTSNACAPAGMLAVSEGQNS